MAANKTLDSATTTTASAAFLHPLPQVRQFHRSLTTELDEKNARLRTLVGGSYRQLLGTAEMILEMRENIDVVEDKLGSLGKGCGRNVVGGKAEGLERLQDHGGRRRGELEWAAKVKGLEACGLVIGRLLKKGNGAGEEDKIGRAKSLVVAAKVLVLSRLLAKSTGDLAATRSRPDRDTVEETRRKLGGLRRRLLRAIDKTLESTGGDADREDFVLALSAYSLATSSGAKDVLMHFLSIRGQALALAFDEEDDVERHVPGVIKSLELYTRTLLDVQALVPRRLSEALAGLKTKPLLKDVAIREVEGLRLDVCEQWFGNEILVFTPYIRHDDLDGPLAVERLRGWAKKASEVLLQGFGKALRRVLKFKTVVDLRTRILQIWIKDGGRARGFDPSILLDGLRDVVNDRMVQLLESSIKKLHLVATEVEGTLCSWEQSKADTHGSLWGDSILDMEISHGASPFKDAVIARTHGRNNAVSRVFKGYQTWRHLIDEIIVVIEQLRKQRWDDDLEDIEDDDTLESRNTLLSTDDPNMLQEHLNGSLERAYKDLHEKLASLVTIQEDNDDIGKMSVYVIRVIRDLRSELPKHNFLQAFGLSIIPTLHERLASTVSSASLEAFFKTVTKKKKKIAGRALWEGNPELPVQPSPAIFKLLSSLTLSMANLGSDLWSFTALGALKRYLREELTNNWTKALEEQKEAAKKQLEDDAKAPEADKEAPNGVSEGVPEKSETEEESPSPPTEDKTATIPTSPPADPNLPKEQLIQSLFDLFLLQNSFALSESITKDDKLSSLTNTIIKELDLDTATQKRLQASGREYWKRTSLLFGLLS